MNSLEELRWLEYQQRLIHHQRNPLVSGDKEHSAHILFDSCIAGGFKALGRETNGLEQGEWLQVQVYDKDHELLEGVAEDKILSTLIFSGPQIRPKQVINKGKTVVEEYRHINLGEAKKIWREAKLDAFRKQNHS